MLNRFFVAALPAAAVMAAVIGAGSAHAQTTAISLRAVSDKTTYMVGDQINVNVYLDVTSLASGDNYTAARFYLAYVQNPSSGTIPATSLFADTQTVTTFTGANSPSGFVATAMNNSSAMATSNGASFVGFAVSENAGSTPRTDTGSFLLATASGTVHSGAAAGNYSFEFEDFGGGIARTFVTGRFGGVPGSRDYPSTLSAPPVSFSIIGPTDTPEPTAGILCVFGGGISGLMGGCFRHGKRRGSLCRTENTK